MTQRAHRAWPLLAITLGAALGLGASCSQRNPPPVRPEPRPTPSQPQAARAPDLRLYFLVDLDGYLEPCGCQSRPLGGIDRIAQAIEADGAPAGSRLVVATGNLFFEHPAIETQMVFQEQAKAERIAAILNRLGLAAWAPGPSDFALGAERFRALSGALRAPGLASNAALGGPTLVTVGGRKVGVVGVSDFRPAEGDAPAGAPSAGDPVSAARAGVAAMRAQGAEVVVLLASTPRRVARSLAELEGVDFVVAAREESATLSQPERIGGAYLVTAPSQGRGLGVVDLYLGGAGPFRDASDSSRTAQRARLDQRIGDLETRLDAWRRDPSVDRGAVSAQQARLAALRAERAALDAPAVLPREGRFFQARARLIDPDVARQSATQAEIAAYFRAVNDHNRESYASLRAPTPAPGQPRYLGGEACRDCHEEAFAVWERTPHSHAYRTLEEVSKNFNLSCVGCHVTGYRQPGGAEVVQNDGLRDVQCEVCHGPGSAHAAARGAAQRRATIRRTVDGTFCAGNCHTPEHSDHFDFATYLPRILGPGHGRPLADADAGVAAPQPAAQAHAPAAPGR